VQGRGDAGQRAAHLDLPQQAEATDVEHDGVPFRKQSRTLVVIKDRFTLTERVRRLDP
jgi:hypothetical protein